MTPDLAALVSSLRALAEKATPGEWRVSMSGYSVKSHDPDVPIVCSVPGSAAATPTTIERWLPNADYIAAVSPDVVLKLCDALESEYARGVEDAAAFIERLEGDAAPSSLPDDIRALTGGRDG